MATTPTLEFSWDVLEFNPENRNTDWYWALGLIAMSLAIISFIFSNVLFGIFIIISGVTLSALAIRKPKLIHYELTSDGLMEGVQFYPYRNIRGYFVEDIDDGALLLLELDRWLMPIITVPIPENINPEEVSRYLRRFVTEKELKEPHIHYFLEYIGL